MRHPRISILPLSPTTPLQLAEIIASTARMLAATPGLDDAARQRHEDMAVKYEARAAALRSKGADNA